MIYVITEESGSYDYTYKEVIAVVRSRKNPLDFLEEYYKIFGGKFNWKKFIAWSKENKKFTVLDFKEVQR